MGFGSREYEAARRIVALALMMAGIWLVFWPGPAIALVRLDAYDKTVIGGNDGGSFDTWLGSANSYPNKHTNASGWLDVANKLKSNAVPSRRAPKRGDDAYAFRMDEPPFDELGSDWEEGYVAAADGRHWIKVERNYDWPFESDDLPAVVQGTLRDVGLGLLAASLLLYLLLPRRRPDHDALHYKRLNTVILQDFLGFNLFAMFYAAPIMVIYANAPHTFPLDPSGNLWGTLLAWLIALPCAYIIYRAWKCSWLQYRVTDEGFEEGDGHRARLLRWDEMESWHSGARRVAKIAGTAALLTGNAAGAAALVNPEHGITIRLKDGKKLYIMGNYLQHASAIPTALTSHDVPFKP